MDLPPPPQGRKTRVSSRAARKAERARRDEEFRAQVLKQLKDLLIQGDRLITNQKQEMARNTDFEQGFVQLPSSSYIFVVSNRERLVELIAEVERGAPVPDVKKKMRRLENDAKAWQERAQKFNVK